MKNYQNYQLKTHDEEEDINAYETIDDPSLLQSRENEQNTATKTIKPGTQIRVIEQEQPKQRRQPGMNKCQMTILVTFMFGCVACIVGISVLSVQVSSFTDQIDKLKSPLVLFQAWRVSPDTDLRGKVIKFTYVSRNIGNGYNKSTGHFTAPIAGVYIFTLQICSEQDKHVSMEILVKGQAITNLYSYQNVTDYPCVSTTGFASLLTGDQVWVNCPLADSGDSVLNSYPNGNFFSGVLIHK